MLLLENEAKSLAACVGAQACWLGRIEVRQGRSGREGTLGGFEGMLEIVRPNEFVPGAEEWG